CGRDTGQLEDAAQPEPLERRQAQPAHRLRDMEQRVRPAVAVVGRVGQRPDAARIDDHDGRAPPTHAFGLAISSESSSGANTCRSTRSNTVGGAYASTTNSARSV